MGFARHPTARSLRLTRRDGQALVESCLAIAMISLLFFGLFQVGRVFAAKEVLQHAAARAARARSVGFNRWMVVKSMRAASIPNAGAMLEPIIDLDDQGLIDRLAQEKPGALWDWALGASPASEKAMVERARIPEYMGSDNDARASYILDYEEWDSVRLEPHGAGARAENVVIDVIQRFPLEVALHRTYYAPNPDGDGIDRIRLRGHKEIEAHYPYYMDDMGW